jgi:catechol 2,3-dioxygenase-like lactoylglutathione lyase family enzyme
VNLNHLHLKVRSVDRARAFYARYFGLADHVWHGDMVFMRDGAGMDLALAPAEAPEPMPAWFHFGFRLENRQAVVALHEEMSAAGAAITDSLADDGDLVFFRVADPDGYAIEVYWEEQPVR